MQTFPEISLFWVILSFIFAFLGLLTDLCEDGICQHRIGEHKICMGYISTGYVGTRYDNAWDMWTEDTPRICYHRICYHRICMGYVSTGYVGTRYAWDMLAQYIWAQDMHGIC